jgi:hypothetical protein
MAKLAVIQPAASSSTGITTHGLTSVSGGPIFASRTINVTISKAFPITLSGAPYFCRERWREIHQRHADEQWDELLLRDNRQYLNR